MGTSAPWRMSTEMRPRPRVLLGVLALTTGLTLVEPAPVSATAEIRLALPSSPYTVTIDGDPREALLLGAKPLPGFDPVTGAGDGRFRGYLLTLPEGLYAAALDAVPKGQVLKAAVSTDAGDSLLGEWVALRLRVGEEERLFVLAPEGVSATLDGAGRPAEGRSDAWAGMDRRFGHTWAAEWLIPWEVIGAPPGGDFQAALVRGRKATFGGRAVEVLATTAPERSASRFGAQGRKCSCLAEPPPHVPARLRPLDPYEVRPFVPESPTRVSCRDAVPAGEFATAWFEVPPSPGTVHLSVEKAPAPVEFFRVEFWWQAGPREEQAALFPARAAAGEGDCLVAERLLPISGGNLRTGSLPIRVYARMRVPKTALQGRRTLAIRAARDDRSDERVPWNLRVVPALPKTEGLFGIYYLGVNPSAWPEDLQNLADHGLNAATCYAPDAPGQKHFREIAQGVNVDGRFPLAGVPVGPEGTWGYASDEPASAEAIRQASQRARDLRARGLRPWAALCWPRSLELLPLLDGVALSPGMVLEAADLGGGGARWVYFMGGREDPAYIRRLAAGLSRFPGLSGFWVWCYASRPEDRGEWDHPFYRDIACRAPDGQGGLLDTVQWEALRDGIVDRRLAEAIQARRGDPATAAPALEPAQRGSYWLPDGLFPHGDVREGLATEWAQESP